MEETLGKRIVSNRKRLGLTQDQLAEQLGVTAQAVSKWENDQSCPDITTLPKLADIFNTTTDALLGIVREDPAINQDHTSSHKQTEHESGVHIKKGNWEFRYDNSRTNHIFLAIWALLVGSLYLINNILFLHNTLWDIVWPSAMVVFGIRGLYPKFSFLSLGVASFGLFCLVNLFLAVPLQLNSGIIISVILLLIGGAVLMDALRRPKKSKFQFEYHGNNENTKTKCDYEVTDTTFDFNGAFGNLYQNIQLSVLEHGEINTSFGDFTVDLSGVDAVSTDCEIEANVSFGNLILRVPSRYRINYASNASFASVEQEGRHDPNPAGVINLEANVSFGQIMVQYI